MNSSKVARSTVAGPLPALIFTLLAFTGAAFAADQSDWTNVRSQPVGSKIGVILSDMKRIEGDLTAATDSSITIRADQVRTINRDSVIRVYRRPRLNRKWRILIGTAIGLGAGAATSVGIANGTSGEGFGGNGAIGAAIAGGAGIGAAVGAATGGGDQTIYRCK